MADVTTARGGLARLCRRRRVSVGDPIKGNRCRCVSFTALPDLRRFAIPVHLQHRTSVDRWTRGAGILSSFVARTIAMLTVRGSDQGCFIGPANVSTRLIALLR